jgi:hypothetical protein
MMIGTDRWGVGGGVGWGGMMIGTDRWGGGVIVRGAGGGFEARL